LEKPRDQDQDLSHLVSRTRPSGIETQTAIKYKDAPSTMQSRAFSVVGPLDWNGLPLVLRSLPRVFSQKFLQ